MELSPDSPTKSPPHPFTRAATDSHIGRSGALRSWNSPDDGFDVLTSTKMPRPLFTFVINGISASLPWYGLTVTASQLKSPSPRNASAYAADVVPISARFVERKLRLDGDRGTRARLDDFAAEARECVAVRNSRSTGRVELRIDTEHYDAVLETRSLYKAIGKIHGYGVFHTAPRGSHRALRFRSRREHPLVDNKKKRNANRKGNFRR